MQSQHYQVCGDAQNDEQYLFSVRVLRRRHFGRSDQKEKAAIRA